MESEKQTSTWNKKSANRSSEGDSKNEMQLVLAKMMEEKHTYTYRKLVVPMSMRSIYWKFFGFPATEDGDILTKVKIVCILCKTQIAYNRNTSNLRMHLQNKHNQDLIELEMESPPKKTIVSQSVKDKRTQKKLLKAALSNQHIYTTNVDGTVQVKGDIEFVTDTNISLTNLEDEMTISQPVAVGSNEESTIGNNQNVTYIMSDGISLQTPTVEGKTISDAIADFIIMDLQLPEIVEGRGFQRLIATLSLPCEIPSKAKLEEEIIPKLYDTFKESVASSLACVTGEIGLSIEEWKSNTNESFITITVYYQNPGDTTLDMKVLSSLHVPPDWGESQWGTAIDTLLLDWDLRIEKITAVIVATMRSELLLALSNRGLTLIPCLLHTLQICANNCFESPEVAKCLEKCRTIIGAIADNVSATETLNMQEQMLGCEEALTMDYPTIWTSTYNMLEQMTLRRTIINSIAETVEGIDQDILDISNDEWKMMEDLVSVLHFFKVTIMTLAEEKMPLISLLKPLLWQLVSSHLKIKDDDSDATKAFKESLSENLIERYSDANVTLLLQIATLLDPRFRSLPYASDEEKNMATLPIKNKLKKLIQEGSVNHEQVIKKDDGPTAKKSRLSGMELLLGNLCSPKSEKMPAQEKADLEFIHYQSEPTAGLGTCPLQWWDRNSIKCPNLSKLARRYNCVPACCAPPSRISAEMQVLYDSRRACLPPHLSDKLLFLHGNHSIQAHNN